MRADFLALDLPMSVAAPGLARRAVEELDLEVGEREDVRLVVSELVTNAVLHSNAAVTTSIRITALIIGGILRVTVTDGGTGPADVRTRDDAGLAGGFGLLLVDRLAARWGVERGRATTVWYELALAAVPHPRRKTSLESRVPTA